MTYCLHSVKLHGYLEARYPETRFIVNRRIFRWSGNKLLVVVTRREENGIESIVGKGETIETREYQIIGKWRKMDGWNGC